MSMSAVPRSAEPSPGLRNFLLIWFGQLVSGVGSRLTTFALGLWVYQTTGSTTRFALSPRPARASTPRSSGTRHSCG